ncbi:MAG: hypothetical protein AAFY91_07880 [Bacteroidota bacterium]
MRAGRKKYIDQIRRYFEGEIEELSAEEEEYLGRLRQIKALLVDARSSSYIYDLMMNEEGLTRTQIYKAKRDCVQLFGDLEKVNRDMSRHIAMEMALDAARMAKDAKDSKALTMATNAYVKAAGLHLDQSEVPDFDKLQPSLVVTALPEGQETMLIELLKQGAVKLNRLPDLPAEDVEFEAVENEPTE